MNIISFESLNMLRVSNMLRASNITYTLPKLEGKNVIFYCRFLNWKNSFMETMA